MAKPPTAAPPAKKDDSTKKPSSRFVWNPGDVVPLFYGDVYVDPLAQYPKMTAAELREYERELGEKLAAEEKAKGD